MATNTKLGFEYSYSLFKYIQIAEVKKIDVAVLLMTFFIMYEEFDFWPLIAEFLTV